MPTKEKPVAKAAPKKKLQVIVPDEGNEDVTVTVDRAPSEGVLFAKPIVLPVWAFALQLLITGVALVNLYLYHFTKI